MNKKTYKRCDFCGKRVKSRYQHYKDNDKCRILAKEKLESDKMKLKNWCTKKTIKCKICNHEAKELSRHIKTEHNLTAKEYKEKYGEVISEYEKLKKSIFWREKNSGINNPMYKKKPWNTNINRKEEIREKLGATYRGKKLSSEHKENLSKAKIGITGKDANAYGPHNISLVGRQRMREGNEKALLEFRKNKSSKFEDELSLYVEKIFLNVKRQEKIGFNLVDFYIPDYKIIIEADGIYWHGIIDENYATDQQKHTYRYDKSKTTYLLNRGYSLVRIREDHFYEHKKKGDVLKWLKRLLK